MTWCGDQKLGEDDDHVDPKSRETSPPSPSPKTKEQAAVKSSHHPQPASIPVRTCPSCGHEIKLIKDQVSLLHSSMKYHFSHM